MIKITLEEEISSLKQEIKILKSALREVTDALKLMTEKDERAKDYIDRVDKLLADIFEAQEDKIVAEQQSE